MMNCKNCIHNKICKFETEELCRGTKVKDIEHECISFMDKNFHTYIEEVDKQNSDSVNHPSHYTSGKIECIDYIQDKLTPEEFRGCIKGNCLKYITRERHKNGDEDLKKAKWYLDRLIDGMDGSGEK